MKPSVAGIVRCTLPPLSLCCCCCCWAVNISAYGWKSDEPSQQADFPRVSINENLQMRPKCFASCRRYDCACGTCLHSTIQFAAVMKPTSSVFILNSWNIRLLNFDRRCLFVHKHQTCSTWWWCYTTSEQRGVNNPDQAHISGNFLKRCLLLWLSHLPSISN